MLTQYRLLPFASILAELDFSETFRWFGPAIAVISNRSDGSCHSGRHSKRKYDRIAGRRINT